MAVRRPTRRTLRITHPPADAGEHSAQVLTELGLDAAQIEALRREGAI